MAKLSNREAKLTMRLYGKESGHEWARLTKNPFHKLEFDTTMEMLLKYLPKNGNVLDAGGGPGRYTIELAKMGYKVTLLDITPENLKVAKGKIMQAGVSRNVMSIEQGTITDLSRFKDNTFDSVLCLGGPLSHVHPERQRRKALAELIRVAKHHAPILISVINKYPVFLQYPRCWPDEIGTKDFSFNARTGDSYLFHNEAFVHFFTLQDFESLFDKRKVSILERIGLEGLASADHSAFNRLAKGPKTRYRNWMRMHREMRRIPFVIDASDHMMIVVRKR